jgi:hypothetical protein
MPENVVILKVLLKYIIQHSGFLSETSKKQLNCFAVYSHSTVQEFLDMSMHFYSSHNVSSTGVVLILIFQKLYFHTLHC